MKTKKIYIGIIGICVFVIIITIWDAWSSKLEIKETYSNIGNSATNFIKEINTAESHLNEFTYNYTTNTVDYNSNSNDNNVVTTPQITLGEKNALKKAKDYLEFMAYSYKGLSKQLEFEGFLENEIKYAVDNCGADWNEQASKKAKDYLGLMSYSRSGLIKQLEFEGFTSEQAEYGVTSVGY